MREVLQGYILTNVAKQVQADPTSLVCPPQGGLSDSPAFSNDPASINLGLAR